MYFVFQEIPIDIAYEAPVPFWEDEKTDVNIPLLQEVDVPLKYLSLEDVKALLGRSERTIRRYVREGYIQAEYKMIDGHRRVFYTNRSVLALKILIENKPNFHYHGTTVGWFYKEFMKIFYDYYRETMKISGVKIMSFMKFMQQEFNSL